MLTRDHLSLTLTMQLQESLHGLPFYKQL